MIKKQIISIHKTLSDPTRLDICSVIWQHPGLTGKELLVQCKIAQPTLSFHLSKLEQSGIIIAKKEGQSHYYNPNIKLLEDMIQHAHQLLAAVKKK